MFSGLVNSIGKIQEPSVDDSSITVLNKSNDSDDPQSLSGIVDEEQHSEVLATKADNGNQTIVSCTMNLLLL